ncbi:ATP-NAD kinase [Dentipellis sp. KUC8613]|nr:ATP-NAD kinase [Dentipellis sp. KUC8613]
MAASFLRASNLDKSTLVDPSGRDPTRLLPNELLAHIFLSYRAWQDVAYSDSSPFEEPARGHPTWLSITQVCRRWREVAISCSRFWEIIPIHNPECTKEMLQRSKNIPITVSNSGHPVSLQDSLACQEATEIALSQSARVVEMRLEELTAPKSDSVIETFTSLAISHPLSSLERLKVTYHTNWCVLPSQLFRNSPRLQRLQLFRCSLPWGEALSLANITYLDLSVDVYALMPTASELLDALASMPKLRTLILNDSVASSPNVSASRKLALPCLEFLSLNDDVQACADFLGCLEAPPDVDLRLYLIQIAYPSDFMQSESRLIEMLQKYCGERCKRARSSLEDLTSLTIGQTTRDGVRIRLGSSLHRLRTHTHVDEQENRPHYDFTIHCPTELEFLDRDVPRLVQAICTQFPPEPIRNLRAGGFFDFSKERWLGTFRGMKFITSVEVEDALVYGFLDAFKTPQLIASSLTPAIFPMIQNLTLVRGSLDHMNEAGNLKYAQPSEPPKSILIVNKHRTKPIKEAIDAFLQHVRDNYPQVRVFHEDRQDIDIPEGVEMWRPGEGAEKIDLVVTLGGDGTILHASSLFRAGAVPPVLSFSMGTLGFLLPFHIDDFSKALASVFEGKATVLYRMRLLCTFHDKDGKRSGSDGGDWQVMNEVALHRGSSPHLNTIDAFVDGQHLTEAVSDGLIVSTPTGSTAYSLSAGGPIVHPSLSALVLTPICPRSLSFRPLVFPASSSITLRIGERSRASAGVSMDGQVSRILGPGESVTVRASLHPIPCINRSSIAEPEEGREGAGPGKEDDWVRDINNLLQYNATFRSKALLRHDRN